MLYDNPSPNYTTTSYDALGRPKVVTSPDGSKLEYGYNGLTTSTTFKPADGEGGDQVNTVVKNALGQKIKTIDNDGNELNLTYDAFGNLVQTTDPRGNQVKIEYNIRGHKVKMDDPDQGVWHYSYYADGLLRSQTDAKGQVLVQPMINSDVFSHTQSEGTSNWYYDTCLYGKGKLCSVTDNNGYTEIYAYNSLGLPYQTKTRIEWPI